MADPVEPQSPLAQEPGTASPLDLPEMEKLLTKVEAKDDKTPKLSKSLSGALDLEQNGHGLPFKVISEAHLEAPPSRSQSRASSRRASSIVTASYAQDREVPKDYLILAIASCFCPVWPLNLIPLIFSIMSRGSVQQGDLDGARRLGRLARLLSITFIILGIVIIIVAVTVNFTGEAQPHGGVPGSLGQGCSEELKLSRELSQQTQPWRLESLDAPTTHHARTGWSPPGPGWENSWAQPAELSQCGGPGPELPSCPGLGFKLRSPGRVAQRAQAPGSQPSPIGCSDCLMLYICLVEALLQGLSCSCLTPLPKRLQLPDPQGRMLQAFLPY
ncbi:trafficking regulator of GLUT4 1 [Choloepus didactylus]|uniref:trafficking regulator of GLUT4 1 n=1 Tax=Choloepus didactylus TaxID=27675 RepID=UPI00189D7299|nr:trafficking regulator of GLUT4 1 [Choloepus didactylus]